MKHLLSALASRKVSVNVDESDLRALLSRAHKFRGDSKGGETWEETLEKVLVELRTSEYATAFLKPVKKSEAWDYDRVIKHPMDLQTMGKKIRSHSYLSKKAFADDLTLIWDNCLTYNTDPAHPLRRAAQFMRKKSDHILRRIPDRHERFAPRMFVRFKFTPNPSSLSSLSSAPATKGSLTNGIIPPEKPVVKKTDSMMDGVITPSISPVKSIATLVNGVTAAPSRPGTPTPRISIQAGGLDIPFEDRPALERTPEGMAFFVSVDAQMDELLAGQHTRTVDTNITAINHDSTSLIPILARSRSSSNNLMMNGAIIPPLDVNDRLKQLGEEDDELAVWKMVVEDTSEEKKEEADPKTKTASNRQSKSPELVDSDSKKRKRADDNKGPRKRPRLEKLPEPVRSPLENWWHAMGATSLLANAVPASIASPLTPNPRYARYQASSSQDQQSTSQVAPNNGSSKAIVPRRISPQKRRRMAIKAAKEKPTLHRLMSENIRARKRARELAIRITDQIEEEKQGADPEDLAPLIPPELTLLDQKRKTWSQRAGLLKRRRQEFLEDDIGPAQAQDCMESTAMIILEHANFDSSSSAALQVFGDLAGRCLQNLGRNLKILHETHHGKMSQEEMVLHTLFSNSIGNMHELETYVRNDIIKHGVTLSKTLNTLEEVALKKDEPMDEDVMLNDDGEIMSGLGLLGEDVYGFREMGLDTEFGMKGLDVPRRLLRPKEKAAAKEGAAEEVDKYPPPPTFVPLETKRIDGQIGLLRPYYHQRVTALARAPRMPTPPPPPPPVPIFTPPTPEPVIKAKSPTPEAPSTPVQARTPSPPPPAPIFDPYNPSALSIFVPKTASSSATPAPAAPPSAPTPAPAATPVPVLPNIPSMPNMPPMTGVPGIPGMIDPATGLPMGMFPPHMGSMPPIPGMPGMPGMIPGIPGMVPGMQGMVPMPIPMQPMLELPEILEDDSPDPSRVKVGPLGQIQVPSAATVAKQKRQHKAAAQAKAAAAAASAANATNTASTPAPITPGQSASVLPGTPSRASVPLQSPISSTQPKKVTPKKAKKVEPVQA